MALAIIYSVPVAHSVKTPLARRVWYAYAGQPNTVDVGPLTPPSVIARVLDDGTSQLRQATYNAEGQVTSRTDPLGRTTTYTYDANGVDLLEVRQLVTGGSERVAAYAGYTGSHRPTMVSDAAGQVTTLTYNAAGQVLTSTNAREETTTFGYDPNGYLTSVTAPMTGATTTYGYDTVGRVRTVTNADAYTVTTDYDALDRPTVTTYPDGTAERIAYDRLRPGTRTDRLGRVTRYSYDGAQHLTAMRDPAARVLRYEWCACGALDALVDANGHRKSWARDVQGRVTREVRADGTTATTYTYDSAGRLTTVTDPKGQVTTYTYAADDAVLQMAFTNAQVATPSVSYTYDGVYPRVATMVDGTGTTTYTYHPAGELGAGQVAAVDGPLPNDTITYTYDALGQAASRAINGVAASQTYDALGRVTADTNVLGTFTYGYDGVMDRVVSVA